MFKQALARYILKHLDTLHYIDLTEPVILSPRMLQEKQLLPDLLHWHQQ